MERITLSDYIAKHGDKVVDLDALAALESIDLDMPVVGDKYFTLDDLNSPLRSAWGYDELDLRRYDCGNIFRTREAAEFAAEKRKVKAELERLAKASGVVDWGNSDSAKWFIIHTCETGEMSVAPDRAWRTEGTTYFSTKESAENAIKTIGAYRIKKYLFGVGGACG